MVKSLVSEEQNEVMQIVKSQGSYGVVVDPIDGVSCDSNQTAPAVAIINNGVVTIALTFESVLLISDLDDILDPNIVRISNILVANGYLVTKENFYNSWIGQNSNYILITAPKDNITFNNSEFLDISKLNYIKDK